MALFVLGEATAERNINSLLEGYMVDGVEVLDDDDKGPDTHRTDNSNSSSHIFDNYDVYKKDEYKKIDDETAEELKGIEQRLETAKQDFKTKFNNRPKSWLESKLIGFKKMLTKFRARHKATKGNKSKTIIQKIIYVITNIINFINDKLIKLSRVIVPIAGKGRRYDHARRNARNDLSREKRIAALGRKSAMNMNQRRKDYADLKARDKAMVDYVTDTVGKL